MAGLVYSETPKETRTDPDAHRLPWYQSPTKLAGISLLLVIALNLIFPWPRLRSLERSTP